MTPPPRSLRSLGSWGAMCLAAGLALWALELPWNGAASPVGAFAAGGVPSAFGMFGGAAPATDDVQTLSAGPVATRPSAPPLAEAFATSTDLRAFVAQARLRPAEGGSFYALRALSECRLRPPLDQLGEIDIAVERSHAQLRRRSEYIERSHRRCDAFLDDELADSAVQALEAQGLAAGDRLVASFRRWTEAVEAGDYDELEAALAEAFALADPMLLEWIGLTGADYWIRPNGRVLSADNDLRARMVDVWRLLPCELGADCAAGNAHEGPDCLFAGRCEPDRRRSVTADDRWSAAPGGHSLDDELQRLLRAIRTRDARLALGRATPD